SACLKCHDKNAHTTIGLEVAQLDRDFDYGGGRHGNQIATLDHVGMLDAPPQAGVFTALPAQGSNDSAEHRARSYLHANCPFCHRGATPADVDLRFSQPLASTRTCGVQNRIVPGDPDHSTILLTMRATDGTRMPPYASKLVDDHGTATIADFIRSVSVC